MVEVDYGRAIRLSLAEVTGGELVSLELLQPASKDPVWESEVATQQGQLRTVRLDATRGDVLETATPPSRSTEEQRQTEDLLDEATVLPGEAAREAKGETDGPVTAVKLQEQDDAPLWAVDVASVDGRTATTHHVDAQTGEVIRRTPA
ncbi:PepSY domain-containing protein [Streptomyces sp. NPDC054802]